MTYDRFVIISITTGVVSGTGTAYPFGAPELTPVLNWVRVAQYLVICGVFVDQLFVV